jgi:hypothetical protein
VNLELPPTPGVEYPYTAAGNFEAGSFNDLVDLIQKHFLSYPSQR